jgi:hypothetical protein
MTLTATFSPLPPRDKLEPRWRALEARAEGGFFLGWTWMESWLSATGATPELLAVKDDAGGDAALALIGRSLDKRLLGRTPTLWLNQAGQYQADRPFIEYNGLLADRDAPADLHDVAMRAILRRNDWRALRLSGVAPDSPLLAAGFRRRVRIDQSPAYHVDLDAVRAAKGDYLSLLSANTRSQIKRAAKDYGVAAPVITVATAEDVDGWLAEMQALNTGRHAENAWDDAMFRLFVATLLRRGLVMGDVELLRITVGDHLLGLLLNFVHRGRAMNYQSAFAAPLGPKGKPGLLCHAAAVGRYAGMGLSLYSLLAGKDRYKQSLSTGSETLEWWSLERFSPRLEAEAVLRKLLRRPVS